MAIIEGGRVSESGWLKVITALLGIVVILGGIVWGRIEATLDTVIEIQIMQGRHAVEISEIKRRIDSLELVRGKQRAELVGETPFRFRDRAGDKRSIPATPKGPPETAEPVKPEPRDEPAPPPEKRDRDHFWDVAE